MKQKFSTIFILLLLFLAGSRVVAQNAPKPFDIEQPSLRVFLPAPELATGRAVVACPGGGYSHLAFEHEGCDWAPYFNKQGIALIVLKYRMPNGDRTLPISDAEAAMKLVRDSADVWNLNPNDIGIMGSSAGGHLAAALGTIGSDETVPAGYRPNLSVLYYPVIDMVSRGYGFPEIKRDFEKIPVVCVSVRAVFSHAVCRPLCSDRCAGI